MSDDDFNDDLDAYLTGNPGVERAVSIAVDLNLGSSSTGPITTTNVTATNTNKNVTNVNTNVNTNNTNNTNVTNNATNATKTKDHVMSNVTNRPNTITRKTLSFLNYSSPVDSRPASRSSSKIQRDLFGNVVTTSSQSVPEPEPVQPEVPTHHEIDYEALQTYIYPINYEIRDYQFNIIEKSFYNNILVALPTGLGKTFIAATIILNYFRWFPDLKIIFMAPTKPLVAQQIKACFNIIGMKDKFAILLDKLKRNRQEIWDRFNIFFTTPQVVENDLCNGIVNPKTVSLLIVDEAHKSKGNYAYNNVVKFLNRFNQSYRIVALTATPSATVEGIKEIIENLGINKIEIRTENSIDIIKYFKTKSIDKVDIDVKDNLLILTCMSLLEDAAAPFVKQANERHLLNTTDVQSLNGFKLLEISKRNLAPNPNNRKPDSLKWLNHFLFKLLIFIANGFKKLKIYGYSNFKKFFLDNHAKGKKSKNKLMNEFFGSNSILELLRFLNTNTPSASENGNISHPKISTLIEYINEFYQGRPNFTDSKIIIFTEYRDSALEIVTNIEELKNPDLNPHIFIGQAPDSSNSDGLNLESKEKSKDKTARTSSEDAKLKGMNQKVQKQLIKDFKEGKYNILVATSIGEEGLDIGEVDLIICYDSTSSPIKNIQRLGRTGRKREGQILMLFSANERDKFDKAMDNYEWIQKYIISHERELTRASPPRRILPKQYKPVLVKKFIDVNEITVDDNDEIIKIAMNYMKDNEATTKSSKSKTQRKPRKSEKITKKFFMPDNVETGFMNVSELLNPGSKPKQSEQLLRSPSALQELDLIDTSSINTSRKTDEDSSYTDRTHAPEYQVQVQVTNKKSLGPKRQKLEPLTETPKEIPKEIEPILIESQPVEPTNEFDEFNDDLDEQLKHSSPKPEAELPVNGLDDDLHHQLEVLASSTQIGSSQKIAAKSKKSQQLVNDAIAPNTFSDTDGFLSSQEKLELFTNYYNPPIESKAYPPVVTSSTPKPFSSTKSSRFIQFNNFNQDLDDTKAKLLLEHYHKTNESNSRNNSIESCISYLNNH